jgi:hypothetical protein
VRFADGAVLVRERSQNKCEVCGLERGVATHHRQPRGIGGVHGEGTHVNRASCLVRVCAGCHSWLETQEREAAYDLGLLVRRPTDPETVRVWLCTSYGEGWHRLTDDGCYEVLDVDGDLPPTLPGERTRGSRS